MQLSSDIWQFYCPPNENQFVWQGKIIPINFFCNWHFSFILVLYLTGLCIYGPVDIQIFSKWRDHPLICDSAHVLIQDQIFIDFLLIDFTVTSLLSWKGVIQRMNVKCFGPICNHILNTYMLVLEIHNTIFQNLYEIVKFFVYFVRTYLS